MSSGADKWFVSAVASFLAFCTPAQAAGTYYQQGVASYNKGNFADAVTLLSAAVNRPQTNTAGAQYYLANALMRLRRDEEALKHYQAVLKLSPTKEMRKNSEEAIKAIEASNPKDAKVAAENAEEQIQAEKPKAGEKPDKAAKPGKAEKSAKGAKAKWTAPNIDLGKLPAPPNLVQPKLYAGSAHNWTFDQRRSNLPIASDDLSSCQQAAADANTTYLEVNSTLTGYLPTKSSGLSDAELKKQQQAIHAVIDPVIAKYKGISDKQAAYLKQAQAAYDACTKTQ